MKDDKNKVLTVTYYVEPRDLRMVTIPVARLNVLLVVLAFIVLWGFFSAGYIVFDVLKSGSGENSLELAATQQPLKEVSCMPEASAVEPMQQRERQANETAQQTPSSEVNQNQLDVETVPDALDMGDQEAYPAEQPKETSSQLSLAAKAVPVSALEDSVSQYFEVLAAESTREGENFELVINIKNLMPERAEGHYWGELEVRTPQGSEYIKSENFAEKRAENFFAAKRFTTKKLRFHLSDLSEASPQKLRVFLYDKKAARTLEETLSNLP